MRAFPSSPIGLLRALVHLATVPRARALAAFLAVLLLAACSATPASSPSPSPALPSSSPTESIIPPATGSPTPQPQPTFPLTLADDEGTQVALATVPHRVVSLTPGTTEIAFALGLGSRVVGVTDSDDYPPAVKSLPKVATFNGVDVEKAVALRPDVVLAGGNGFNKPADIQKLRSLGIPVLVVYAPDLSGVLADIKLVGTALGEGPRAAELANAMQQRFDAIGAAAAAAGTRPRVFYELDATSQIFGPAPGSFVAGMITTASGDPITSGDPKVFSIPLEKLVAADPEIILLGDAAYGTTAQQVTKRPGWGQMTAVQERQIRPVDDTVITRPGPRLAQGLADLAVAIHPGLSIPAGAPLPSWSSPSQP